ncbi:lysylphosphatidylglycerol synthase domain-containing protein [Geitlerinema sp. PCC 9228]|jgi:hypothetical protein|uniref:lysylphosphatidylglycerol synthase domain-containing protein n=1 Tax=Geitlerinema sp. PCC 9228 TaxID=111611 RepID=UPI0008F9A867|nr:lysylphosphatidylglycerol synthase domain-containing protein [Geitlerinema sp. PCC 9228]
MKQIGKRLKSFLRWAVLGATLFFLATTFKDRWQEVAAVRVSSQGGMLLAAAFAITLVAHVWSALVWGWILREFQQVVPLGWAVRVFLQTNIAKYLPGNVWHFYGRVVASQSKGLSVGAAALSVVVEPLLMAAAALAIAVTSTQVQGRLGIQIPILLAILMGVHPRILNPIVHWLGKAKTKIRNQTDAPATTFRLQRYPLLPLLGELIFVGLRGTGFLVAFWAFQSVPAAQFSLVISAFSFAWLLGLVIPGAPGGMGVFEATSLALLDGSFSPALVLVCVAFYRVISILAEAAGAGMGWLFSNSRSQVGKDVEN